MIIMINGTFGVGKSTVARLLRKSLKGSVVYDPEFAGSALMRLGKIIKLKGSGTDDFQDIVLWRKLTVAGIRLARWYASGPVIVPMTFSRRDYLDEIVAGLEKVDNDLRVFCLHASLPTVRERLAKLGDATEGPGSEWLARRTDECSVALADPHFGEYVETEGRSPAEVATYIVSRLRNIETNG
jgi:broad-specificity NMP kinase